MQSGMQVTSCEPRSPRTRPRKPARMAPSSGRKTMATYIRLAPHLIDILDLDRAAIAEIDDQDRQADGRLAGRDGQHEERENLADEIAEEGGKGDEIEIAGEQHQLD